MNTLFFLTIATWAISSLTAGQFVGPRSLCTGSDVIPDRPNCSRTYTRCVGNVNLTGICPEGFMGPNRECRRRPECGSVTSIRGPQRFKRQASGACPDPQFDCPNNLIFYIYPDWNDCSRFYTCARGQISVGRCSDLNFQYFNPNLFSCEVDLSRGPATPRDNVCVNRATRLG